MARDRGFHGQARRRLPFNTPLEVATPGARLPQELLQSLALTSAAPIPRSRPVTLSVPLCSMSVLSWTDIFPDLLATDIILNHRHADILTNELFCPQHNIRYFEAKNQGCVVATTLY